MKRWTQTKVFSVEMLGMLFFSSLSKIPTSNIELRWEIVHEITQKQFLWMKKWIEYIFEYCCEKTVTYLELFLASK